jgi:hypothetical protein
VSYLHLTGVQDTEETTIQVVARAEANYGSETLFGDHLAWSEVKGSGDGSVPVLSAARTPAFLGTIPAQTRSMEATTSLTMA